MNILITGGCGFLGARLARTLLALGSLSLRGAPERVITRITLADRVAPPDDLRADPRVHSVTGDLLALIADKTIPAVGTDLVFHLAAAVSGECEADFDLGMRSNLETTHKLLDGARALGTGLWQVGDQKLIDGTLVNGSARVVGWFAAASRRLQTGYIYHYAFAMIIGVFLLMTWFVWFKR